MTDFFISYTQTDRTWAEWIAWQLEEAGFKTKLQAWDFLPGRNFVTEMQKAAKEAERTIAILSQAYLSSAFGQSEWSVAFAQDPVGRSGKLLPIRVEEVSPEGLLSQIVYIDLAGLPEEAAKDRLLSGISQDRAKPTTPPAYPHKKEPSFPGKAAIPPTIPTSQEVARDSAQGRHTTFDGLSTSTAFADLLNAILLKEISPNVKPFSSRDASGDSDATFKGGSGYAPNWEGSWLFQYKFIVVGDRGIEEVRREICNEVETLLEEVTASENDKPNNYIFITNVILSTARDTATHDWFVGQLVPRFAHQHIENIEYWDGAKILILANKYGLLHQLQSQIGLEIASDLLEEARETLAARDTRIKTSLLKPEDLNIWNQFGQQCYKRAEREIRLRISHKFIKKLYVPRALDALCDSFLQSDSQSLLIVDKAGSGKTNLLCNLTLRYAADHPVVFLPGKIPLASTADMEREIFRRLGGSPDDAALQQLLQLAENLGRPVLIFIDGINENDRRDLMKESLLQLLLDSEERPFRFFITCRDLFWDYFKEGSFWRDHAYLDPETPGHKFRLRDFTPEEFLQAKHKYFSYFNLTGRLLRDAESKCYHPLLLRFFCEAHGRSEHERQREGVLGTEEDVTTELGEVPDIRLKTLFDLYWERKIDRIKELDRRIRSSDIIENFLYKIARQMRADKAKALSKKMMEKVTGQQDSSLFDSIYTRIYDEDIIFEEEEGLSIITFVYDEFMEYTMARQLYKEELDWTNATSEEIGDEIRAMTSEYVDYNHIDNIVEYLLLWLEDEQQPLHIGVANAFLDSGEIRLLRTLCSCLPKFRQIDNDAFKVLSRLARHSETNVRKEAAEAIGRVLHRHPRQAYSLIKRLAKDHWFVQYGAVLGLGYQGDVKPKETAKILHDLIKSESAMVRGAVARFYRSEVGRQLHGQAMSDLARLAKDDDDAVQRECLESAVAFFAEHSDDVFHLMTQLTDPWVCRKACDFLLTTSESIAGQPRLWRLLEDYVERDQSLLTQGVLNVIRKYGTGDNRENALHLAQRILDLQDPKTFNECVRLLPTLAPDSKDKAFEPYDQLL